MSSSSEYPNKNQKTFTFLENYVGFRLKNAIYFVEAFYEQERNGDT
jgi:hypothetical protein